ncbi:MAG: hypothetical protein JRH20_25895 [Deltaproteobacteria bacterium]|nr:hypothetical protein [Deltaproteobacteria bacterium]
MYPRAPALSRRAFVALLFCTLVSAGCREDCLLVASCCTSCDDATATERCGECSAEETPAYLCPKRSACALAHYIGEGPALCCEGSCGSIIGYEAGEAICRGEDVYLHECAVESDCFQIHRALAFGTLYLPFHEESSGSGMPLSALWGAEDQVWAVGAQGRVLRREAGLWRAEDAGCSEHLTAVWASSDDVWVVGYSGTVLHYTGARWGKVEVPTSALLTGIWGRSATEIWIVGEAGTILRFDGMSWQAEESSVSATITAIHGTDAQVVAVGPEGLVLRRVDGRWQRDREVGSEALLTSVFVDEVQGRVWACGLAGTLLERTPEGRWIQRELPLNAALTAVWHDGEQLWVVGYGGTILRGVNDAPLEVVSYFTAAGAADLLTIYGGPRALFVAGARGAVLRYDWE